ncbi:SusD/RagB family nutrient-binding outer membrane lipoprotein [Chitinophaga sp.]|uniref:SusD/RagB family nutrient-binding outer membrane lipoprotein n=1 Tax=Chitinophaga sp. TaxID=1869181 RepID=UPI002C2E8817|nr:SusD/RagB family nutrient-binding outer membrane lipoprotein [Chitinophaga sp.]HWV64216.1 SusD/RagB family nutrient-binding outer membrane lipoprotein [Chitinophaga sp.]
MKRIFLMLLSVVGLFACTKNFDQINTDPNHPNKVEPDFLLTTSQLNTLKLYGGDMNRVIFFNYTQHFSGFQGEFQRYTYNDNSNNTYWSNTYINCLQPAYQIEVNYRDNPAYTNRVLIARIWKDFIFSNALSMWGSIPMEFALAGSPGVAFTREQDAYYNLLEDLKNIVDAINPDGDKYSAAADKIYGGDLLKWKKFANTLRLRLAMRISNDAPNGDPELAKKVVQDIYQNGSQYTITAQNETAAMTWGTTSDTWSYLYNSVVYNYTANKATIPVLCESLVYHTQPYNDPRLTVYGQPAKQGPNKGKYFGQNISYGGGAKYAGNITNPHDGLKQDDYSYIGSIFLKPDAEYVFMSWSEAALLKAEAALKGWWGNAGNASQYYYEGINASFDRYGLTQDQAAAYENTPGIKWGTAADTVGRSAQFMDWVQICSSYIPAGEYYRQIIMQHWLAIPGQGVDAWALIRRSRTLELEPQFATYDGEYAYLPQRIPYPGSEYSTNSKEVSKAASWLGGSDDLWTKLWFALPNKKNPYLPY